MRDLTRRGVVMSGVMLAGAASSAGAGDAPREAAGRPVHTFSIVARDARTGELGVAVRPTPGVVTPPDVAPRPS